MPTTISDDKKALDILSSNTLDQEKSQMMRVKLGVNDDDVYAWKTSYDIEKTDPDKAKLIRNKVYNKVAEAQPIESPDKFTVLQGVRFLAKNFIDQDVNTQKKFFQKLGYPVEADDDGFLYIYDEKKNRRLAVDPKTLDAWDVSDIITDLVEGAGVAATTAWGAKTGAETGGLAGFAVGGPIGAAVGGTAGLLIGGAAGAYAPAFGAELARQGVARAAGARDEIDIGRASDIGNTSLLFAPLGALAKGAGQLAKRKAAQIGTGVMEKAQDVVKTLREAAQTLGVELTPGQLKQSPVVQKLEASLAQTEGTIGGKKLRQTIQDNKDILQQKWLEIIEPKPTGKFKEVSDIEAGTIFGKSVTKSISEKLAPAKVVYDRMKEGLKDARLNDLLPADVTEANRLAAAEGRPTINWLRMQLKDDLTYLKDELRSNPDARKQLATVVSEVNRAQSIQDIRKLLTYTVDGNVAKNPGDQAARAIQAGLGDKLRSIRDLAMEQLAERDPRLGKEAVEQLKAANTLYADVAGQVRNLVDKPVGQLKPGVSSAADQWLKKVKTTNIVKNVIETKNAERIAKVAKDFPEAFESVRQAYVTKVRDKLTRNVTKDGIDVAAAAKQLDSLPKEFVEIIWGPTANKVSKATLNYLKSRPAMDNPSRTAESIRFDTAMGMLSWPMAQVRSLNKEAMLNRMINKPDKMAMEWFENFIDSAAKGTMIKGVVPVPGITPLLYPAAKENKEKSSLLPKKRGLLP
jgi:hypothetical protein